MKSLFIYPYAVAICFAFASTEVYGSDVVADPVQAYIAWIHAPKHDTFTDISFSHGMPTTIMKLVADIDGDGQPEILLTNDALVNGMEGLLWRVYTPVEGGYRKTGGVIFHPKAFYVGDFEGRGWGIVKYFHGSSASGLLVLIRLENGRFEETTIREIFPKNNPEDMKLYGSLFGDEHRPTVEETPLSSFPEPEAPAEPAAPPVTEPPSKKDTNVPQTPASPELSPTAPPSDTQLPVPDKPSAVGVAPATVTHPSWTRLSLPLLGILLAIAVIVTIFLYLRAQKGKRGEKEDGNP